MIISEELINCLYDNMDMKMRVVKIENLRVLNEIVKDVNDEIFKHLFITNMYQRLN